MTEANLHIAFCGLDCSACLIYKATIEPDRLQKKLLRKSVVEKIQEIYGIKISVRNITDCDGCRSGSRLFSGCDNCTIRPCALNKNLKSCAYCIEYPCEKLLKHFEQDPQARAR
jgi:hypothetical protein